MVKKMAGAVSHSIKGDQVEVRVDVIRERNIQAVVKIWNESFPDLPLHPQTFKNQLFREFKLNPTGYLVARNNSHVVGFALATTTQIPYTSRTTEFPGCIPAIAVAKKARRKGIGTQLLKRAEEYLIQEGTKKIRIGYPTYLRGTILSLIGVDTQWTGAIRFLENFGYAPKSVFDSMILNLADWKLSTEVVSKIRPNQNSIRFGPLSRKETAEFIRFMRKKFSGSWYDQFNYLYRMGLLKPKEVLVMKERGKISGFAGPFHITENGDTCGIGLGIANRLRGKGLGLYLLYNIIQMVKEKKVGRITLFGAVDKINYYGQAGFLPGSVWLTMEKDIKK